MDRHPEHGSIRAAAATRPAAGTTRVSAPNDGALHFFNPATKFSRTVIGATAVVSLVPPRDVFILYSEVPRLTPNGKRLLTREVVSGDIRIWDCATGQLLLTIPARASMWTLSNDGAWLAVLTQEGYLRLFDARK